MELKHHIRVIDDRLNEILIAPIWNWNVKAACPYNPISLDFNRTNMELKHESHGSDRHRDPDFNRTNMELKQVLPQGKTPAIIHFNRTNMELKRILDSAAWMAVLTF